MSDHIWQVTASEREDGIYLFEVHGDAEAFAEALTRGDEPFAVGVEDTPINRGEGAAALIAAERGDRIEDAGMPAVAEDVREGIDLSVVLRRLVTLDEDYSEAAALLRRWRDEDTRRVGGVDETDARAYVEASARDCIADLCDLEELAGYGMIEGGATLDPARLAELGIDPDEAPEEQAEGRLNEMPLAVEITTTFEIVLGVGGPDRRLCLECDRIEKEAGRRGFAVDDYEVRRVFYRYSWSGSATVELTGSDRQVAEAFARRVVLELA